MQDLVASGAFHFVDNLETYDKITWCVNLVFVYNGVILAGNYSNIGGIHQDNTLWLRKVVLNKDLLIFATGDELKASDTFRRVLSAKRIQRAVREYLFKKRFILLDHFIFTPHFCHPLLREYTRYISPKCLKLIVLFILH